MTVYSLDKVFFDNRISPQLFNWQHHNVANPNQHIVSSRMILCKLNRSLVEFFLRLWARRFRFSNVLLFRSIHNTNRIHKQIHQHFNEIEEIALLIQVDLIHVSIQDCAELFHCTIQNFNGAQQCLHVQLLSILSDGEKCVKMIENVEGVFCFESLMCV